MNLSVADACLYRSQARGNADAGPESGDRCPADYAKPAARPCRAADTQVVAKHPRPEPRPKSRTHADATLISYMALFLLLSLLIWCAHGQGDGTEWMILIGIYTGTAIACFLIFFAVYWLGRLLRMHARWLAEQHEDQNP